MTLPSPSTLLQIPGFDEWFPGQEDSFSRKLAWFHSDVRFLCVAEPAGSGKSIGALLLAKLTDSRTLILTSTKGLQVQYQRDVEQLGGVVVLGQPNFKCLRDSSLTADKGPCHDGSPCLQRSACPYQAQLHKALSARIVIANYAYWLAQANYSTGLGEFELAVFDEAALAFSAVENFMQMSISNSELRSAGLRFPVAENLVFDAKNQTNWAVWRAWFGSVLPVIESRRAELDSQVKPYRASGQQVPYHLSYSLRTAKSLVSRLERLSAVPDSWVVQKTSYGYSFIPRWVADYSFLLFQGLPKVMLMSAVMSHKVADSLGVPSGADQRGWMEVASSFPIANTPIWHVPTARMIHTNDDYANVLWAARQDHIIQRRLDRKGIIFTVSYTRAQELVAKSRFKDIMLLHNRHDVYDVVEKFKQAEPPKVLVSPVVTTGWDFPEHVTGVRYLVISKLPFPDTRDLVAQARRLDDKDWAMFLAMQTVVQESFRGSRSVQDRVEVLVTDDNATWFIYKYRHFAPKYFMDRWRGSLKSVPDPLV